MNAINKMIENGTLKTAHPGAEADLPKLNEILKNYDNYIPGLTFNGYEVKENGVVTFTYDHPDTYSAQEVVLAKELVRKAKFDLDETKLK